MITTESISKMFSEFSNQNALVIGDVMVDSYIWGNVSRISPEAPVPIVEVKKRENRLGGAANVGLNLKALGATAILCSVIGTDQRGDDFTGLLKKKDFLLMALLNVTIELRQLNSELLETMLNCYVLMKKQLQ